MSPAGTGYWQNETSGVLRDAILAYLENAELTPARLAAIRAYFVQWVAKGDWGLMPGKRQELIDWARTLRNRQAVSLWLATAEALGLDPL